MSELATSTTPTLLWVYSVGLLVLGFILVLLEIFVIPGLNIIGIAGLGTIGVGVLFAYRRLGPEAALIIGVLGMAGTGALVWLLARNHGWQRLVHSGRADRASGYDSAPAGLTGLVGQVGTAITALRPSGRASFGEQIVDVVSEGGFVDVDASVQVQEVHGNRVVVRAHADA